MKQDADTQAAKEAHEKIEAAKVKIFGVSQAKATLQQNNASGFRQKLQALQQELSLKKIGQADMNQRSLALLLQLESFEKLNAQELMLKDKIQNLGTVKVSETGEIGGSQINELQKVTST